jgi:beta-lactamase regulating signal transducer with metallopeptidase domain
MIDSINSFSAAWAEYFLPVSLQNAAFLSVIILLLFLLRKKDARLLQGIAMIGIVKLLIPPFIAINIQRETIPAGALFENLLYLPQQQISEVSWIPDQPVLTMQSFMMFAWILVMLILGAFAFYRRRMRAKPVDVSEYLPGDKINAFFLKSTQAHSPLVVGLFRYKVILPGCWEEWTDECKRSVIAHETAHIRRHDNRFGFIQSTVQTLHFFNPLVWLLSRNLIHYREMACDDYARKTANLTPARYSKLLLKIAESIFSNEPQYAKTAFAESKSQLEKRVCYQLDIKKENRKMSKLKCALILTIAAALILPFSWYCSKADILEDQSIENEAVNVDVDIDPYVKINISFKHNVDPETGEIDKASLSGFDPIDLKTAQSLLDAVSGKDIEKIRRLVLYNLDYLNIENSNENEYIISFIGKMESTSKNNKFNIPTDSSFKLKPGEIYRQSIPKENNSNISKSKKDLLRTATFDIPADMTTEIKVYDTWGQRVRSYPKSEISKGKHTISFDGKDDNGNSLETGVYIVRVKGEGFTRTKLVPYMK